jgi:hypothetical protein
MRRRKAGEELVFVNLTGGVGYRIETLQPDASEVRIKVVDSSQRHQMPKLCRLQFSAWRGPFAGTPIPLWRLGPRRSLL